MNPNTDPLAQLRDLHVPHPVSFWPPAFGWWLVVLFILLLIAIGIGAMWYRKKTAPRRVALAELTGIKAEFETTKDSTNLMRSLSQLLRRYAIVCFGREHVAGLTGVSWLKFLDVQGKTHQFSSEAGRQAFIAVPYGAQESIDAGDMITLVERWIKFIPLSSRKKAA